MTTYETLMRQHDDAPEIIRLEKAAWDEYVAYMTVRINQNLNIVNHGDPTSHLLFQKWRAIRAQRDRISNPRHKRRNIRFQPRSNGNA